MIIDSIKGSILLLPITSIKFYNLDNEDNEQNIIEIVTPEQESNYNITPVTATNSKGHIITYGYTFELNCYVPNNNIYSNYATSPDPIINSSGFEMLQRIKILQSSGDTRLNLRLGNNPDGTYLQDPSIVIIPQLTPENNINYSLLRNIIIKRGNLVYTMESVEYRPRIILKYQTFLDDLTNKNTIEFTGTDYVDEYTPDIELLPVT